MENDTIIDGFNLSALLRNFNILRNTVAIQGKIIETSDNKIKQLQAHAIELEKKIARKEDNTGAVIDDLFNGFLNKKGK